MENGFLKLVQRYAVLHLVGDATALDDWLQQGPPPPPPRPPGTLCQLAWSGVVAALCDCAGDDDDVYGAVRAARERLRPATVRPRSV